MLSIQSVALLGNLAFTLVCTGVGIRLLALYSRTRQLPEALLGGSFLSAGLSLTLGFVRAIWRPEGMAATVSIYAARVSIALAVGLILVLAWRVFRPTARWAQVLVVVNGAVLLASVVWRQSPGGSDSPPGLFYWLTRLALIVPYAWASVEAYLFQRDLRRRQSLGLAPRDFLATRLALWSAGLALSASLYIWFALAQILAIHRGVEMPTLFVTSGFGMLIAICFWLAFFPPRSWVSAPSEEPVP